MAVSIFWFREYMNEFEAVLERWFDVLGRDGVNETGFGSVGRNMETTSSRLFEDTWSASVSCELVIYGCIGSVF